MRFDKMAARWENRDEEGKMRTDKELLIVPLMTDEAAEELRKKLAEARPTWGIEIANGVMESMISAATYRFDAMIVACTEKYARQSAGLLRYISQYDRPQGNCFLYIADKGKANGTETPDRFGTEEFDALLAALAKDLDPRHADRRKLAEAR